MAAKKKKAAAPPKKKKATRKEVRENPGAGHNAAALTELGTAAVERFFALKAAHESDMAGFASDFAKLYEEEAGNLGLKQTVINKELNRLWKNKKAADKEKEMKSDERKQTELFRSCFAGTPFEEFAEGDLAAPEGTEEATEEEIEEASE